MISNRMRKRQKRIDAGTYNGPRHQRRAIRRLLIAQAGIPPGAIGYTIPGKMDRW